MIHVFARTLQHFEIALFPIEEEIFVILMRRCIVRSAFRVHLNECFARRLTLEEREIVVSHRVPRQWGTHVCIVDHVNTLCDLSRAPRR